MLAALALEAHAQRPLQRLLQRAQGAQVGGVLQPGAGFAGVGGQEEGQVLRVAEGGAQQQGAAQEVEQPVAVLLGRPARVGQLVEEGRRRLGQAERLQRPDPAQLVEGHQDELAVVGDQHQPVAPQVAGHLLAGGHGGQVVAPRLDLGRAALRAEAGNGRLVAPLELVGGIEAEVGFAAAAVLQLLDGADAGLQPAAGLVEQRLQRAVVRLLGRAAAGVANLAQVGQVGLDGVFGHGWEYFTRIRN